MKSLTIAMLLAAFCGQTMANEDRESITRAVKDYIESQHQVEPERMQRGLDKQLAKRTYWQDKDGREFIMETDHDTMVWVAENYNLSGDKFPTSPQQDIEILDIDQRVASVKLTADEWIDYMHLYKTDQGQWKIINVLWQYKDTQQHSSKK